MGVGSLYHRGPRDQVQIIIRLVSRHHLYPLSHLVCHPHILRWASLEGRRDEGPEKGPSGRLVRKTFWQTSDVEPQSAKTFCCKPAGSQKLENSETARSHLQNQNSWKTLDESAASSGFPGNSRGDSPIWAIFKKLL